MTKTTQKVKITIKTPAQFLASGFGSGCAPIAPGTFGTLAAVPLWLLASLTLNTPLYIALIITMFVAGVFICNQASRELNVHDHGGIVWDEFVGFMITMIAVPVNIQNALLGFALFRLFDIWKPWPINVLDKRVSGGFGIMLDDVIAGLFALLALHGILYGYGQIFL